jgi:hypothetical protein
MSAGTQGFIDTRQDTNHIGKVISTILEARKLAEDERKYAESVADKYQTSLEEAGIKRGDFFKKALRWKFGGEFKQKKLAQLNTWKTRGGLLKSALSGKSGRNKLDKFERTQALFDMFSAKDKPKTFRDKFKPLYQGFVDDPMTRPMSHWVKPGTAKKIQKATGKKQRVSKEDILDSLGAITESIQKVAESISEKNKVVADQMIHSSVLQGMLYQELQSSGSSLEEKLQKIIDAISNQTEFHKQTVERAKSKDAENRLERQKDAAGVVSFDDLTTEEDESKVAATSAQDMEFQQMSAYEQNDIPKAEQGGIFSGPDSGYLAELHGNEMVVPLDNNFTQGEPSAVDGKLRPKPQQPITTPRSIGSTPKYEMGTSNISNTFNNLPTYEKGSDTAVNTAPITSKFGFNTTNNITGIAGGGTTESSKLTQSMVDVMSLPMMAAGGTILSATTKYMQSLGGEGANINPEIERVSRPIASVFGLPPAIVGAAKKSVSKKETDQTKDGEEGESKKDLLSKLMDGFGKLLEKLGDSINTPRPEGGPGGGDTNADTSSLGNFIGAVESGNSYTKLVGGAEDQSILNKTVTQLDQEKGGQFAMGKYQIQMRTAKDVLKGKGIDPSTFVFNQEGQDKLFKMLLERRGLGDFMSGKITKEEFALELSKEWAALPKDAGGRSFWAGVGNNKAHRTWEDTLAMLDKLKASGGDPLAKTQPPQTTPTTTHLGQAITNNYGLQVGQEREFDHPQYGKIKAHKTRVGFEFFTGGTILDMSSGKPQAESIVNYFTSTNGGQQIQPPPSSRQQTQQQVSSISTSSSTKSSGGGITVLNTGGGQQIASAGSSPQPSGDGGVESGRNPTQDFFNNPFSLGVG